MILHCAYGYYKWFIVFIAVTNLHQLRAAELTDELDSRVQSRESSNWCAAD